MPQSGRSGYHVVAMSGTTDGSGDATANSPESGLVGEVAGVLLDGAALDAGADVTVSAVYTDIDGATERLITVLTLTNTNGFIAVKPREFADGADGADEDFNANEAGLQGAPVPMSLVNCSLRAVVAQGGASKAFGVRVLVRM